MGTDSILLLYPPHLPYHQPPLGLAYLAAVLQKNKYNVSILDASVEKYSLKQTIEKIKQIQPLILGVPVWTPYFNYVTKLTQIIKKYFPQIVIVAGGPHATALPNQLLEQGAIDYVVIGEGEYTFLELCRKILDFAIKLESIKGIAYKANNKVVKNENREFIKILDEIPIPARHLLPINKYRGYGRLVRRLPTTTLFSSRGCPYQCIFCGNNVFGRKFRFFSSSYIINEIQLLINNYKVKDLNFLDDNLTVDEERVAEICTHIIDNKIDISWMCNSHINSFKMSTLELLKKSGCWLICLGVETGDEKIQKFIGKNLDLSKVKEVFEQIQKAGIKTLAYFQIGNIQDTTETIRKTIDFAKILNTDFATFSVTVPFPGTKLWETIEDNPKFKFKLEDLDTSKVMFGKGTLPIGTETLTVEELMYYDHLALREFYLRPKQMLKLILGIRTMQEVKYLWDFTKGFFGIVHKEIIVDEKERKEIDSEYDKIVKNN